jgi:hypothetical protein
MRVDDLISVWETDLARNLVNVPGAIRAAMFTVHRPSLFPDSVTGVSIDPPRGIARAMPGLSEQGSGDLARCVRFSPYYSRNSVAIFLHYAGIP